MRKTYNDLQEKIDRINNNDIIQKTFKGIQLKISCSECSKTIGIKTNYNGIIPLFYCNSYKEACDICNGLFDLINIVAKENQNEIY